MNKAMCCPHVGDKALQMLLSFPAIEFNKQHEGGESRVLFRKESTVLLVRHNKSVVANAVNVFSSLFRDYKGDFHEVLKYKDSVCSCYTNNS